MTEALEISIIRSKNLSPLLIACSDSLHARIFGKTKKNVKEAEVPSWVRISTILEMESAILRMYK